MAQSKTAAVAADTASRPAWMEKILDTYKAGVANGFILTGNVRDYAEHPDADEFVRTYIAKLLSTAFTVAIYSLDEGITFGDNDNVPEKSVARAARSRYEAALGLNQDVQQLDPEQEAIRRAQGLAPASGDGLAALPTDSSTALPQLVRFLRECEVQRSADGRPVKTENGKRACLLVDRLDLIAPPADKGTMPEPARATLSLLSRVGTDTTIAEQRALVILLAPSLEEVHPDLRSAATGFVNVDIPPPDYGQRLSYCQRLVQRKELEVEIPISELAAQTAGLDFRSIETLAVRAESNEGRLTKQIIRTGKADLFLQEYSGVLEILEPDVDFDDIGGHELAKSYFRRYVVRAINEEKLRRKMPKGILLMGPAGTGKTYLAQALARATGLNCVQVHQGRLKGPYVGESERRLEKAIQGILALAPCIVFWDELDQGLRRLTGGGGGGGDAVEGNLFGRILQFVSDPSLRGQIVFVGATNQPNIIDPALKRAGRFGDAKIPLLPPLNWEERASVLRAAIATTGMEGVTDEAIEQVARQSENRTQAELAALVVHADGMADIEEISTSAALVEAVRRTRASTAEVQYWSRLALAETTDVTLVPAEYQDRAGVALQPSEVPESIKRGRYQRGADDDELGL